MTTAALLLDNLALGATLVYDAANWALSPDFLLEASVVETVARCPAGTPDKAVFELVWPAATRFDTVVLAGGTPRPDVDLRLTWYSDPVDRSPATILAGGSSAPFLPGYPPPQRLRQRRLFDPNVLKGRPRAKDLAGKTPMLVMRPASSPRCRALRIEIDNHGASLDLGMLCIGRAFIPTWPHDWGMRFGARARSIITEAPGGARVKDRRRSARHKVLTFSYLTEDDAMVLSDAGQRIDEEGGVVMMIEDIRQSRHLWRRTWPADVEGGIELRQERGGWVCEMTLLEVIG